MSIRAWCGLRGLVRQRTNEAPAPPKTASLGRFGFRTPHLLQYSALVSRQSVVRSETTLRSEGFTAVPSLDPHTSRASGGGASRSAQSSQVDVLLSARVSGDGPRCTLRHVFKAKLNSSLVAVLSWPPLGLHMTALLPPARSLSRAWVGRLNAGRRSNANAMQDSAGANKHSLVPLGKALASRSIRFYPLRCRCPGLRAFELGCALCGVRSAAAQVAGGGSFRACSSTEHLASVRECTVPCIVAVREGTSTSTST